MRTKYRNEMTIYMLYVVFVNGGVILLNGIKNY